MKKQGAPEPLSEEHFANLKRKKGLPVDDIPAEVPSSKKRRTSNKPIKPLKGKDAANLKVETANPAGKVANGAKNGKKAPLKSKKASPPSDSDEEMDDEFGASDLDDLDDIGSGDDSDAPKLGDDFMDSGSSVYDSDQDHAKKEKFVFSDDEDEDEEDREEKLTAANIEGLSRKLDEEREEAAAENEAELRQDALQTNIAGDKPHILGDNDEEDELSSKTKGLLAPDLQMLRTRITETIRVLEDFANLAEEGRNRAEYTDQMLKDFCACKCLLSAAFELFVMLTSIVDYGYNEYLAEKLMCVCRLFCELDLLG
jgi:25S rRNA (cytosine2870-C5)-methyltransferase